MELGQDLAVNRQRAKEVELIAGDLVRRGVMDPLMATEEAIRIVAMEMCDE